MELAGKIAVVTGASSGIGLAIARALGEQGCRVAICARTALDLENAAQSLRDGKIEVLSVPCDVTSEDQVSELANSVHQTFGPADILVNNAGIGIFGELVDLKPADFDAVFDVNVRGLFLCSRAFAPPMAARGDGVIVNVASLAGKNGFKSGSVYAASKHAVMGMSKCMLLELREHGVRVITVCPGSVDTPFVDSLRGSGPDREAILRPEDVADIVVAAIRLSDRGTVSEIDIRPVNP